MSAGRYRLDGSARRLDGGRVLLGGSPLTLFRLSARGAQVLDAVLAGDPLPASPPAAALIARLVDAGALHPRPPPGPWRAADVTVVVPVRDADVTGLLARIGPVHEVLVVDDGSSPPVAVPRGAPPGLGRAPVRVLRRDVNGGPAAARNTGLAAVTTPLVAFLDVDCRPRPGWLEPLLAHLGDPAVAAAAPRVRALADLGVLARFDAQRSPLDLGSEPALVRARTRVSYVPAAALVARVDGLRAAGGFDERLRVGEDVDLVWRLDEGGRPVRYEPAAVVDHAPRSTVRAWLAQRRAYGRSAGPLAGRHPGALVPVGVSAWSAGAWGLVAAGHPLVGGAVGLGSTLALAAKLDALEHPVAEAVALAGRGHLHAGRQLANAVTRVWWPLALVAAVASGRARRVVAAAALAPALVDWWRTDGDEIGPLAYTTLRVADDAAYGLGVWEGAWAARTVEPLRPDLTSWPRASRYERGRVA